MNNRKGSKANLGQSDNAYDYKHERKSSHHPVLSVDDKFMTGLDDTVEEKRRPVQRTVVHKNNIFGK
jgi:hypothetical protein